MGKGSSRAWDNPFALNKTCAAWTYAHIPAALEGELF